ncbi:hypothetical protein Tco_0554208 [Tanacetum coccineum]
MSGNLVGASLVGFLDTFMRNVRRIQVLVREECGLNGTIQVSRYVPVSPKIDFKPQKEYRPVTKKPNTSSSVDNDVEFDTNRGTSNLGNNEATPSESSFMNIDNDGEFASNTPIDRSDKSYGTNSLLEQLRDSYPNNDDYDPYDDDMYENHDLSEHLQSICDDLDITVCGRKKK